MRDSKPLPEHAAPEPTDPEIIELLKFEPAPRQFLRERDGWTPARQRRFIALIVEAGSPQRAAAAMQKKLSGVRDVYRGKGAEGFRAAWDRAVEIAAEREQRRLAALSAEGIVEAPEGRAVSAAAPSSGSAAASSPSPSRGLVAPMPVVCEVCAATGIAGDEAFAGIPDILSFDPVPVRFHERAWDEERQRGFIVALAVTGSPRLAAKCVGRHAMGAEKLRKMRGGRGFAEAWDAAMEIARERELMRMAPEVRDLADGPSPSHAGGWGGRQVLNEYGEEEDEDSLMQRAEEARESIGNKIARCRRMYLAEISGDPAKRAAWEVLCGPVDWDRAERIEPQPDERPPNMRQPDMLATVENGWVSGVTGGEDRKVDVREQLIQRMRELRNA